VTATVGVSGSVEQEEQEEVEGFLKHLRSEGRWEQEVVEEVVVWSELVGTKETKEARWLRSLLSVQTFAVKEVVVLG
jgi:hypothetical protein